MKKFAALAFGAAMSFGAYAAPATMLPPGPVYLKFSGQEQIAINGASTWSDGKEINWGVFTVSTMEVGVPNTSNGQIDPGDDAPFFTNIRDGAQITGMFYGIESGTPSGTNAQGQPLNPFPASKGYMDLYWRDLDSMSRTALNGLNPEDVRCGYSCAVGFTEGTFLGRLFFDTGMDLGNPNNTIVGSVVPTGSPSGFSGQADSYASVDTSVKGLWTEQLNSDYFRSYLGLRDLRFKNSYNANPEWNSETNSNILGARIDDPGQAYALPEPGALSLMGLAMVGMGAVLRRREKKAA
ncbi:PEP-CTERM sorting domain-containing protein [Massilia alkalitolerans]|uniref:PEP-CTERM sorting domain-containing protein n=1 Tax=Massilia alkalitolerans TaxID=286638 RepID=UPI0028B21A04|nr:PEP-CTERM sorting domain-containing protein [Massilia alkalitolerans]